MRVLVVEDEFLLAMDVGDMLRGLGHDVVASARDSGGAVAAATRHRPDVVVMDINLGRGPDGIETALKIRSFLGIRSIFVTAYVNDENETRARGADPIAFLTKPLDGRELATALAEAEAETRADTGRQNDQA